MGVRHKVNSRAVFLDRDGVINDAIVRDGKPYPPASIDEIAIPPDVPDALRRLAAAGFQLIVVSNQPDVTRGTLRREDVETINAHLRSSLSLDEFRTCFHDDHDSCDCRKPKAGLLMAAAADRGIDLSQSFMVGDRWRDVAAGNAAGCTAIFIDRGYREQQPALPFQRVRSLAEAADFILSTEGMA